MKSLSRVRLLATPWTVAYQAPPSMGFSRQEYWSGVPLPSPLHTLHTYKIVSSWSTWDKIAKKCFRQYEIEKHIMEKAMAAHSSTLAWQIPWTEEPGRLHSMGWLRLDTTERLHFHFSLFTFMHWRRKWQPTPVFLPRESQGRGCLVDCSLWGCTESDTTEAT